MAFQLSGEERIAKRAYQEMEAVALFPNWYPEHFLDVAEMSYAFAIGYDWLYDYLTIDQRKTVVNAIIKHGINEATSTMLEGKGWWVESVSNWTTVCNGGISVAALAIFEENPDLFSQLICKAISYVPKSIAEVAPNGCYPEGPGYWSYGTSYTVFLLSSLESVLGNVYGLDNIKGFKETGSFPMYSSSNDGGMFNFADCAYVKVNEPQTFWFAKHFNMPIYGWQQKKLYPIGMALDLVWYDSNFIQSPSNVNLPLDIKYDGNESLVTFRSSFEDETALFAVLKAGDNQSLHGDLDIGTFVFDALGTRWAHEMGSEEYHVVGYWDMHEDAGRWKSYGKRAEGHNTIVINPDEKADQNVFAIDKFIDYKIGKDSAYAVVDMGGAYKDKAISVKRGMKIFDNRTKLMIQDEIICVDKSEIYWFMHTDAMIEIVSNGKIALLSKGEKQVQAVLQSSSQAVFGVMDAVPLQSSPNPYYNVNRDNYKKLFINLTDVNDVKIGRAHV